jgi:hypothetical protein
LIFVSERGAPLHLALAGQSNPAGSWPSARCCGRLLAQTNPASAAHRPSPYSDKRVAQTRGVPAASAREPQPFQPSTQRACSRGRGAVGSRAAGASTVSPDQRPPSETVVQVHGQGPFALPMSIRGMIPAINRIPKRSDHRQPARSSAGSSHTATARRATIPWPRHKRTLRQSVVVYRSR